MKTSVFLILTLASAAFVAEAGTLVRFEGDGNERTPVFEPGSPWMLYWYTQSDNALPKTFELRLYEADSGKYLGTVIQQRIIANGEKLFEDPGRYQVDVVAGNLDWSRAGTTLSISKKGSGLGTILDPCIEQYLLTESYFGICDKWNFTNSCFDNEFFPESNGVTQPYDTPTNELTTACSSGYCSCPA